MAECTTNMCLDDVHHLDWVKELHNTTGRYGIIVNDLYSYEKEVIPNGGRFNYVTILSREQPISLDEAAIKIKDEMEMMKIQIENVIKRIKSTGIYISEKYFEAIRDINEGNIYWS